MHLTDGAHVPVVVVGGGQAGLATSWHLTAQGLDHLVLEADRVGSEWRNRRWDSFCLVTPNWQCGLPGFPYDGPDPDGFMVRDEIVDYLEAYKESYDVPIVEGVRATRLDHGFRIATTAGTLTADQVVVATGPYQLPRIPRIAERLAVPQLHSSEYKNPDQLPPGEILVVGTGQSGCQIAEDLHLAGRTVHLATGSAPRVARFYRGLDVVAWLDRMGYYSKGIDEFDDVDAAIVEPYAHVCVSTAVADELLAGWGLKATVIPNGVDAARFAAAAGPQPIATADREKWRCRLGRYVLTVGGIEPRKGSLDLLEAHALLADPDVRLVIAGGETLFDYRAYRAAWDERAAELGVAPVVLGPVDDTQLPALVAGAEVFALPSVKEGFGLAPSRRWPPACRWWSRTCRSSARSSATQRRTRSVRRTSRTNCVRHLEPIAPLAAAHLPRPTPGRPRRPLIWSSMREF